MVLFVRISNNMDTETLDTMRRGFAVMRSFRQNRRQTISQAADAIGLTRATARRILRTLCEEGLARTDGKHFELTAAVLELGGAYLSGMSELDTLRDVLSDLTATFGESASAATMDGTDVVYIARSAARHRLMTTNLAVGTRLPAHATSLGQVILAQMSPNELDAYLARHPLKPFTPRTLTTREALMSRLSEIHETGFALVSEELEKSLRSIAVAVPGRTRHHRIAINLSNHAGRIAEAVLIRDVVPALRRAAERVAVSVAV
jgi:IclR family transcriptional regulator, pca regulon regulatory protein